MSRDGNLLQRPVSAGKDTPTPTPLTRNASEYSPLQTFVLPKGTDKHYAQQFADMYFLRLAQLKKAVKAKAHDAWHDFELGGEKAHFVERVLDVRQGELCWVVGTVYMEMALKPNVLDDISKEHWIAAPPARSTYMSAEDQDDMMLEDESGRLRVTGETLKSHYVTGCILAALGTEQADGTFQVIATQYADLPRQPQRWEQQDAALSRSKAPTPTRQPSGKLAIVSGLEITGHGDDDLALDLLVEYLTGEALSPPDQSSSSRITRLLICGDSLNSSSPILSRDAFAAKKAANKHYGYDASSYDPAPSERLDVFLSDILPTLPITLLPGPSDPANVALPQQPLHPALFPQSRLYASPPGTAGNGQGLDTVTNPWDGDIEGFRVLATSGQTLSDLAKYVDTVRPLEVMEMMLRWRCVAPTAPDTLWCYPFQDDDPLLVKECPHMFVAGCQASFGNSVIEGPAGQKVVLVSVPKFKEGGQVVLVDMESWEVEVVRLGVVGVGE
ncbi:DNA polymerase alpha/epsilon subunit B-domain-containing protein [Phaeosphaeria sp. MPI-PUGE-AT-0046c]|nr:DNA polymerase alpha/epsilon subunit B-domain-containing protein [Phaeosphaeria sp. MPI-PUGE-AT-0046c]